MKNKLKLSFFGGGQEPTGANYLLESLSTSSGQGTKILIDCGLFQGSKISEEKNYEPFSFEPSSLNAVFITHAHLDHIGRLPKLIREGFRGKIFSTPPTRDLSLLMLIDSLGVMEKEAKKEKRKTTVYQEKDVTKTMRQWETVEYHKEFEIGDLKITLKEAGHILGSAIIEVIYNGKKIVFTGDLGNPPNPLLKNAEKITDADYLVIEGIYGDRLHQDLKESDLKLERIIEDTARNKSVLMIPALSLERTQKLLFEINNLVENGRIPKIPLFLDSPLAIKATAVYKKYQNYFNKETKEIILSGDELFSFPGLKMTLTTQESFSINNVPPPKIIIAGSGMSNGGRIIHHEHQYLSKSNNILLLVCYQAVGSLGRQLQDGAKSVNILGETIPVNARIENISGYSAHPDMNELFDFVHETSDTVKKVFVVQGEPKTSLFFVQRMKDYLGLDAVAPKFGESYQLDI